MTTLLCAKSVILVILRGVEKEAVFGGSRAREKWVIKVIECNDWTLRSVGGTKKSFWTWGIKKGGDWEWVKNGRGVQGKKQGLKKKLGRRVTILFCYWLGAIGKGVYVLLAEQQWWWRGTKEGKLCNVYVLVTWCYKTGGAREWWNFRIWRGVDWGTSFMGLRSSDCKKLVWALGWVGGCI